MKVHSLREMESCCSKKDIKVALIATADLAEQKDVISLITKKVGVSPISFSADSFTLAKFYQELEQFSFFSSMKCLLISDVHLLKKKEFDSFTAYLDNPNPNITLIFVAAGSFTHAKLKAAIDKQGIVFDLLKEKPWEKKQRMALHIRQVCNKEKITIEQRCIELLLQMVGEQQSTLECELEKVICFVGSRKSITAQDLSAIVMPVFHETIWRLSDELFASNFLQAWQVGKELLEESSIFYLLSNLRGQVRTALEIITIYQAEGSIAVTRRFAYLKGAFLEKKVALLQRYGAGRLKQALLLLYEAEVQAKASKLKESLIFEMLLVNLTKEAIAC